MHGKLTEFPEIPQLDMRELIRGGKGKGRGDSGGGSKARKKGKEKWERR